jgi:hypothetical protein
VGEIFVEYQDDRFALFRWQTGQRLNHPESLIFGRLLGCGGEATLPSAMFCTPLRAAWTIWSWVRLFLGM